jgi:acetolactate synthase-1/2/3 large subunit
VATLILPADVSWSDGGVVARPRAALPPRTVPASTVEDVARLLRSGEPTALFLGGAALGQRGLMAAARVAAETGVRVLCETFPTRLSRGPGLPSFDRLAYLAEFAAMQLDGLRHIVLVDAKAPVSFFAYPGRASDLVPEGCSVLPFAGGGDDVVAALEALAEAVDAAPASALEGLQQQARPPRPTGALSGETVGQALGAVLPEHAIVSDEANTTGIFLPGPTAGAARHDWLTLTGGAIGQGLPVACGAALAAPDRPVISVESDGSALYTFQSLWTMAREQLNVTVLLLNNRSYAILNMELGRVGAEQSGAKARGMLDLTRPDMDFVALAKGMGVPAVRAESAEELTANLERCIAEPGPNLIEVVVPSIF